MISLMSENSFLWPRLWDIAFRYKMSEYLVCSLKYAVYLIDFLFRVNYLILGESVFESRFSVLDLSYIL